MLVLSRKLNERVVIGDMIEVSVLGISRDKVKLGFNAPRKVSVHRKEIYDLIQKENIAASTADAVNLDQLLEIIKKC
jgi:carbon storage regulator